MRKKEKELMILESIENTPVLSSPISIQTINADKNQFVEISQELKEYLRNLGELPKLIDSDKILLDDYLKLLKRDDVNPFKIKPIITIKKSERRKNDEKWQIMKT